MVCSFVCFLQDLKKKKLYLGDYFKKASECFVRSSIIWVRCNFRDKPDEVSVVLNIK